jgi:sporulation protein YlmC with PRC-barrel domain
MPRQDWREDDLISSERGDMGYDREPGYRDFQNRDRGAFFDEGRPGKSGWRDLLDDERSGGRMSRSRRRGFGPDDDRADIPRDETERLIASNKVEGTPVYDRNGDRLGSVRNFMVDKFRGKVVYAVLKSGTGFLGLDDRYYPLDWDQLSFDTRLGGYRVDLIRENLERIGSWDRNERWSDRSPAREEPRFERNRSMESGRIRDWDSDRSMRDRW